MIGSRRTWGILMALAPILTEHLPSCYTPEKNVSAPVDGGDYSVDRNVGSKKEFFFGTLSTTANLLCVGQGSIFVSFSLSPSSAGPHRSRSQKTRAKANPGNQGGSDPTPVSRSPRIDPIRRPEIHYSGVKLASHSSIHLRRESLSSTTRASTHAAAGIDRFSPW